MLIAIEVDWRGGSSRRSLVRKVRAPADREACDEASISLDSGVRITSII